jgi:hypothetical protein
MIVFPVPHEYVGVPAVTKSALRVAKSAVKRASIVVVAGIAVPGVTA